MSAPELRFGVIGGSSIARRSMLPAMQATPGLRVDLVASRSAERRREIAAQFQVRTTPSYEDVLANQDLEAVYIALPNALHEIWTLRALAVGKHVYCEKPAVLSAAGAARVAALARDRRRVFFEGFMFLFHPQHAAVRKLIDDGAIGRPLQFEGWFGIPMPEAGNFRFQADLGGGALNDAAGYPLHACRLLLAGEPRVHWATLQREPGFDVDLRGSARLELPRGRAAQVTFGFGFAYRNAYAIWGSEGFIQLERAFSVPPDHAPTIALRDQRGREELRRWEPANHFQLALEAFAEAARGERPFDAFLSDFEALAQLRDEVRSAAQSPWHPRPAAGPG